MMTVSIKLLSTGLGSDVGETSFTDQDSTFLWVFRSNHESKTVISDNFEGMNHYREMHLKEKPI